MHYHRVKQEYMKRSARIIDRGRAPELAGTWVTVYRIMDFIREDCSTDDIAAALDITVAQVHVALDYIAAPRQDVEAEYDKILQRVQQRNPPPVEAGRAPSSEALKQRMRMRRNQALTHVDSNR
jgi:uncharacterized protein (DUF433 family)